MLKPVFLTEAFYNAYPQSKYHEIEQKLTRPYICIQILIDGVLWAIPLRSHVPHNYVIWTDRLNGCGIDFTKAVVIEDQERYISDKKVFIRPNEFNTLKRINNYTVIEKMTRYIKDYKKAKMRPDIPRNKTLIECSTLQYFEEYI